MNFLICKVKNLVPSSPIQERKDQFTMKGKIFSFTHKICVPTAYMEKDKFKRIFKNQVVKLRSTYRIQVKLSLKIISKTF